MASMDLFHGTGPRLAHRDWVSDMRNAVTTNGVCTHAWRGIGGAASVANKRIRTFLLAATSGSSSTRTAAM